MQTLLHRSLTKRLLALSACTLLLLAAVDTRAQGGSRYTAGPYSVTGTRATLHGGRYTMQVVIGQSTGTQLTSEKYTSSPGNPPAPPATTTGRTVYLPLIRR